MGFKLKEIEDLTDTKIEVRGILVEKGQKPYNQKKLHLLITGNS